MCSVACFTHTSAALAGELSLYVVIFLSKCIVLRRWTPTHLACYSSPRCTLPLNGCWIFRSRPCGRPAILYAVRYIRREYVLPRYTTPTVPPRTSCALCLQEVFVRRSYLQHGLTIQDGAVVVDAGANVGLFSLQCLREANAVQVGKMQKGLLVCRFVTPPVCTCARSKALYVAQRSQ